MINIMHVTYDMRIGGTEMVIKNLIEGCNTADFAMSVCCLESPIGPWGEELQRKGIPFFGTQRQPGFDRSLIAFIRDKIKNQNIDILHCHQYTPWVYGVLAAIGTPCKVIFTEHGRFYPDSSSWKRKLINPFLGIATAAFTSISEATRHALVEFENLPERRIQVIYNGIEKLHKSLSDPAEFKSTLGIPANNIVLGTIARFDPIKNHNMMLKAFAKALASFPNLTLVMVGDGEERQNIETAISQLNIKQNVVLTGYQSKPVQYLEIMDVFLLSSLSEGTSMTLLEAMSIGKPCVVTHAGGNPEIIEHDYNGIVTPNDDAEAFCEGILKLLSSTQLMQTMGENAETLFARKFDESAMNNDFAKLYKECHG